MIRAVLFDCFGVIITDALDAFLSRVETERPGLKREVMDVIHANNLGLLEPSESNRQIADIVGLTVDQLRQEIDGGEIKDHQVLAWVKELRKTYRTGMLSNIGRDSMRRRFTEVELEECFDAVIISGDLGIAKPDVAIYEYAAQKLAIEPTECVFLDDREGHCQGAESAGMHAIQYVSLEQAQSDLKKILEKYQ